MNGLETRFGVVFLPDKRREQEHYKMLSTVLGQKVEYIRYDETDLTGLDCVILPDDCFLDDHDRFNSNAYLFPVMNQVKVFAESGRLVYGVGDGFRLLCQAALLPGNILPASSRSDGYRSAFLRTENNLLPFTRTLSHGCTIQIQTQHREHYNADAETIKDMEAHNQVVFRYCTASGIITQESSPANSVGTIAGVVNKAGNVFGILNYSLIDHCKHNHFIFKSIIAEVTQRAMGCIKSM